MNAQIIDASVEFIHQPFRKPLQLSTGLISAVTEARARVVVSVGGREAVGRGSIYLSDLWAWPEPALTHAERDAVLRRQCESIAANLFALCGGEAAHPLELGLRLHHSLSFGCQVEVNGQPFMVPVLAQAMCGSPFDAALHDAVGQALGLSAFDFYDELAAVPSADRYFENGAVAAIAQTLHPPKPALDAWLVVGARDDLEKDVAPWIRERGYRCFKLKILGQDNAADAARTAEVFQAVRRFGVAQPRLCVDSNEANPDVHSVLDYLMCLRHIDPNAFAALEYLEQPTGRDIVRYAFDWREVTKLKPVLLDEGLTSLDLLPIAAEQGWSGLALKTCKGHSFALLAAAWARQHGLLLSMQDLTNPGYAAVHAALLAARLPTINGVELNSPQYTPAANESWLPRLNELLEPRDGLHHLPNGAITGLGSSL